MYFFQEFGLSCCSRFLEKKSGARCSALCVGPFDLKLSSAGETIVVHANRGAH